TRHVYELEPLEVNGRNVLFRVRCESGTYIRTLCADIGDALGVGANLVDLRRTRAATFGEADALPLNAFRDAIAYRKEDGDDTSVRAILHPMEDLLRHLPRIVVKDTAVDAICHGANLAVPGVAKLTEHIRVGDLVGVYTGKGEAVALANALMTSDRIVIAKSGAAADAARVLMAPGTYRRLWKWPGVGCRLGFRRRTSDGRASLAVVAHPVVGDSDGGRRGARAGPRPRWGGRAARLGRLLSGASVGRHGPVLGPPVRRRDGRRSPVSLRRRIP